VRRALVVGAARGIGRATALRLAGAGHRVTATWHRTEPDPDPRLGWERCDITDPASVDTLFAAAADDPYDIVVANAALVLDRLSSRMTDADFEAVLDVNLTGAFRVARAALGPMAERRWGRVVLISSVGGWHGNAGQANYAASKAGQLGLARALAREVGPRGITVNIVDPGSTDTDMNPADGPTVSAELELMAVKRYAQPDEIAAAVGYLAAAESQFITGASLAIDGGFTA